MADRVAEIRARLAAATPCEVCASMAPEERARVSYCSVCSMRRRSLDQHSPADLAWACDEIDRLHASVRRRVEHIDELEATRRALEADLERISDEMGLPRGMVPADGEFRRLREMAAVNREAIKAADALREAATCRYVWSKGYPQAHCDCGGCEAMRAYDTARGGGR